MQHVCAHPWCRQVFEISPREEALYRRMRLPLPVICPPDRMRVLMSARNEMQRYRRTCDATGSVIISGYPQKSPYTIYRNDYWWSDRWEALDYGRDYDFARPFFDQFTELQRVVPREGTTVFRSENCDYNSHIRDSKNCYLNALIANCEDAYYSYWIARGRDAFDCMYLNDCEIAYESMDCNRSHSTILIQDSMNCSDCCFSYQLRGCSQCLFCSNLVNKTYHIRNKPCSKEEFEQEKRRYLNGSFAAWQQAYDEFLRLRTAAVQRPVHLVNCEQSRGDHLTGCRDCQDCFDCNDGGEDCLNVVSFADSKDVYDSYAIGWPRCEVVAMCSVARGCTDIAFCSYVWFSNNLRYCDSCQSCQHCFGCTGLRHKQYCILNKQYTKEEYDALIPRIIAAMEQWKEWGMFFPLASLPHAYNETAAQNYLPLSQEEAVQRGWRWQEIKDEPTKVTKTIPAAKLPDRTQDVPNDVLNWAIECEISKRPFRIIKQELEFYRKMGLPLPRKHPDERHRRRMSLRNPRILWKRTCQKCQQPIETTYAPERPETVYCESCYLAAVY